MVLFKRKPVQFLPAPDIEDDNQEVWHIPQTGEVFVSYEDYLDRMDFYKQKRFICTITGHSGLTFFDALESELAGAVEVEQAFPEALKGPILRRVQFQTVSRIDTLVDQIYDEFKNDYYPGEAVTVHILGGERLQGVVRDKTRFGSKVLPDGTLTPPFSRYFVSLDERPDEEAVVDDSHIFRDRKVFTKAVLRSFIKKTVTREAWNGAPWLVKQDVADKYHIDTRIPPHLRYDSKLLERRQMQLQKKASQSDLSQQPSGSISPTGLRLPELKPAPKSHKSKAQQALQAQQHAVKGKNSTFGGHEPGSFVHLPLPGNPFQFPVSLRGQVPPPVVKPPEPTPPPPPPKYPIEDLQVEPRALVRPQLRYMCSNTPVDVGADAKSPLSDKLLMKSVGPLLETWDTLNVYCEIFKLDSFTFDDHVEALLVASADTPVQLFDEIHCAVLKILVTSEAEGGKVQIQLPELEEEDEEEEEEAEQEDSMVPTPEPEPQPAGRATRRSLAKAEAERLAAEAAAAKEMQQTEAPKHRAEEVLRGYDWIEHLAKRDFKEGGWEMIMVGLLHQLSKNDRLQAGCEELLQQLVPSDVEPSQETVRDRYSGLDVNYRVQALQIICMLTSETRAIRGYMEDCSETMTAYRKEKIEWQRKRKQLIEELKSLNDQRKILLPDNLPPSPPLEPVKTNGDVKMSDVEDLPANTSDEVQESDEDEPPRKLRRAGDRAAERKRKAEKEQERKEKAEAAAKVPKQSKQFQRVLKDIQKKEDEIAECEREIAVIDNDLREADCPRTRVLGKDRFWNRYYWFERNGMPYGGLPDSSTASAGYANGCIWVQGPDKLERVGYIDMAPEHQNEYKAKFGLTVPERKKREEGATSVFDACQWGYYDDPDSVDALLGWLDPRGFNELKLRKELVNYRDKIVKNMEHRKAYLAPPLGIPAKENGEDPVAAAATVTPVVVPPAAAAPTATGGNKRMSTRGRGVTTIAGPPLPPPPAPAPAALEPEPRPAPVTYRCMSWQNTMALEDIGHLHSREPPPARSRKMTKKKQEAAAAVVAAAKEVAAEPEMIVTRGKRGRQSAGGR
ncbi:glycosyltransferase family 57 protein [Parathielavia hyrcaniae]|uniref:Glycosyltransferase family 57 protein n=1 Tax=Parathielavia hyrcaniae TaxID=113614 RepID=A0AAN6QE03_9PEZI|nr:glycosyltransferase family 57 protein [Parathielavia hyrcaniae]